MAQPPPAAITRVSQLRPRSQWLPDRYRESIEITVNGDATVEQDETFQLIVGNLQANGTDVTLAGTSVLVSEGFVDSGQRLGSKLSFDVLLGDLDGDGDSDSFAVNGGVGSVGLVERRLGGV